MLLRYDQMFSCSVEIHGDVARIVPLGELDLDTADAVERCFEEAREAGYQRLVLDLRRLSFLDSTGLRLVLTHQVQSEKDGVEFGVIRGSPRIQRVFTLGGVLERVRFVPAPEDED